MELRIKEICKERGMTIKDLATKIGLSAVAMSNLVNSKSKPGIDVFERIASALNVPISDLFEQSAKDVVNCPYCGGKIKVGKE